MIAYLQLFVILIGVESSPRGNCSDLNSVGTVSWFCCDNYEEINGTCIECSDGFESLDGSPCSPCPGRFYGKECANKCHCTKTQICDHIKGCINIQINFTDKVSVISESTEPVKYTSSMADVDVTWSTTVFSSIKVFTFREEISSVRINTRRITSTTSRPTEKNLVSGFSNREIVVYSISAGLFVCVLILCTALQRRYKQLYRNIRRYQTRKRKQRNKPNISLPDIPLEESYGLYEVIDESNMKDDVKSIKEGISSVSNTNERNFEPNINDVLTPYQAVDQELNTHDSNEETTSNRESTSSSSDVQGKRSSYLNPYQPIVHSADIHEYSTTNNSNDSRSLGSETQTRESGYLNPYQPMVPDSDLHNYKSFVGCSDGSCSWMSDTCTKEIGVEFPHPDQGLKSEFDIHENKSVNSISSDIVSKNLDMMTDDSIEKVKIQNEDSYMHMK